MHLNILLYCFSELNCGEINKINKKYYFIGNYVNLSFENFTKYQDFLKSKVSPEVSGGKNEKYNLKKII